MKKVILGLLAAWLALPLLAAEGEWLTDLAKAQAKAKDEKKLVLLDFTGSDWCPPCRALHKNVFTTSEFEDYAKKNLVLVEVDFPRRKTQSDELKKANQKLAEQFEIEAYPTIIILDANGRQLSKETGYRGEKPKEYVAKIEQLKKKS